VNFISEAKFYSTKLKGEIYLKIRSHWMGQPYQTNQSLYVIILKQNADKS